MGGNKRGRVRGVGKRDYTISFFFVFLFCIIELNITTGMIHQVITHETGGGWEMV